MISWIDRGIANDRNVNMHKRDVEVNMMKKRWSQNSYNEEKRHFNGRHMMEEWYQSMLGKHIQNTMSWRDQRGVWFLKPGYFTVEIIKI